MLRAQGFPPVAGPDARILILGSMPGERSLAAQQYYAHPRNAFWPIMGALLGFDAASDYAQKTRALISGRIALWDVLDSCVRPGSLDADIDATTAKANNFEDFFRRHPQITRVYFNGTTAETYYRRHVRPLRDADPRRYTCLPSTSPAHASVPHQRKQEAWRVILID